MQMAAPCSEDRGPARYRYRAPRPRTFHLCNERPIAKSTRALVGERPALHDGEQTPRPAPWNAMAPGLTTFAPLPITHFRLSAMTTFTCPDTLGAVRW